MYDDGILRMSSVPFNLNSLRDPFVHLTNHCIQKKHDKYVNRYSWLYAGFDVRTACADTACFNVDLMPVITRRAWLLMHGAACMLSYGAHEAGNEIFFAQFDTFLQQHYPDRSLRRDVIPAIERVMINSLETVQR